MDNIEISNMTLLDLESISHTLESDFDDFFSSSTDKNKSSST